MKLLAMYLPQFHAIKENNKWWGEGYTEWTAVKSAKPYFKGHYQPKVPLDNNYYDLSDQSAATWKWQSELLNTYGLYGFCIYHYWFNGKQLLEKPMEILLQHKEINLKYCICWANETWTKTWYGLEKEILMAQEYGDEASWKAHFTYLLPFFQDERYIKIDNKPVVNIYRCSDIDCLEDMLRCWNALAISNGFNGVYIIAANAGGQLESRDHLVDAYYNFEPGYTINHVLPKWRRNLINFDIMMRTIYNRFASKKVVERVINGRTIHNVMNQKSPTSKRPVYKGTFPMWDNTPRRGYKGIVYKNTSCELFEQSLAKIKKLIKDENEFVYINAWNEWGEGCYLEPDQREKYKYLETISKVLSK